MTRLTNELRDAIIENALEKSGIKEEFTWLQAERADWINRVRIHGLGGIEKERELRKLRLEIKKLWSLIPEHVRKSINFGFLNDTYMYANIGGCSTRLHFSGFDSRDRFLNKGHSCYEIYSDRTVVKGDDDLAIEFANIECKQKDLNRKYDEIKTNVKAVVYKCGTIKKLIELWPESIELIPEERVEQKKQLPALNTSDLNNMIGLPTAPEVK